jgi:uncharacterized membrane protein YhaH (DUF805 family)
MQWYLKVLKNYATFRGRARRKEYWMFTLFHAIILIVLAILMGLFSDPYSPESIGVFGYILALYVIATFIPSLAVLVRRLHDMGKSGWWAILNFIPLVNSIGGIILLVFTCIDSESGGNRFGPNPKNNSTSLIA